MDERRVADYFVVVGLSDQPDELDDASLADAGHLKSGYDQDPITDIGVIFPSLGESVPQGYAVIERTPTGLSADLNHGSLRSIECYLCFRRGRDKPPLVDIGVMYEGKEFLMKDAGKVEKSVGGRVANVNNSTALTFITFRRGSTTMPCNALVVTDICVVIASKGESPPHAFCCIYKNLNKGLVGSDVFLCYKKSMNRSRLITYNPSVISRYPMGDLQHFPFPNSVPLFCLPMGATLEVWPEEATQPKPIFSTFVLTVSDAKHKVYGSAVTFYEKYAATNIAQEQAEKLSYDPETSTLHASKSICVLSHWPFADTFKQWLTFLYNMATNGEEQIIPIERYIVQLLDEVPFPAPRTLLQLSSDFSDRLIMTQPEDLPLPRSAAGFKELLFNLGSENCLLLLLLALTEQKILIHSLRPDTLTAVAEALSSLLFPFKWQCPYIPLCPLGLVEVLHAPLPFMIGVDSRFFDLYDPPPDVSCVDLDTNIITVCETQRNTLNVRLLPKKPAKILKSTLDRLYESLALKRVSNDANSDVDLEIEFQKRKREHAQELEIQEAFLKFMAITLKGYRSYLLPITKAPTVGTTDPQALFQLNEFLRSRDKNYHKFFTLLMHTQMFIRFIEERSFVADGDQGLAFFDECTERLNQEEDDVRLLEFDVVHKSERTVFLLPPEPTSDSVQIYKEFTLNPILLKTTVKKRDHLSSLYQSSIPGSPMARRTKHEIKSAQKLAQKYVNQPASWARCLSGTLHTLYFMALPSLLSLNVGRERAVLQQAYELLVRATQQKLACDEVCYRLMMQLCGEYSKPLLAVKLLLHMKRSGIQPNALTYGLYNRCVLEAEWPAQSSSSLLLWNKLRCVVLGAARFRRAAKRRADRRQSATMDSSLNLLDPGDRVASRSSLDSHETVSNGMLDKLCTRVVTIVKGSVNTAGSEQTDSGVSSRDTEGDEVEFQEANEEVQSTFSPSKEFSRVLSRSESAGDALILDKLQQNAKKCARNLQFDEEKVVEREEREKSPAKMCRTLITENDPLGALDDPPTPPQTMTPPSESSNIHNTPLASGEHPILFRNSVHRSATFEGSPPAPSKIHRSETVPAATVASSLASLGSSIKMSFGRYSPGRISLRKSELNAAKYVPQNIMDYVSNNFSTSTLTGKKSNEFIQGGLSSLKSAANTMAKKLDEIKEAISTSTTSTPIKGHSMDRLASGDGIDGEGESTDGSEGGERQHKVSIADMSSNRGSCVNLRDCDEMPESLFPVPSESSSSDSEMDIIITSCSQCNNCASLLYDEDIMANWTSNESNLNSICQACHSSTVPLLTIKIKPRDKEQSDAFSVPYLNPLVLRKELENVFAREGDLCLSEAKFVEEHPIIYWNLLWAFERINVQTHLPNLGLKSRTLSRSNVSVGELSGARKSDEEDASPGAEDVGIMQPVEEGTDPLTQELAILDHLAASVRVYCMWDDLKLHGDKPPMYTLWQQRDTTFEQSNSTRFMQSIISSVHCSDLSHPLKKVAYERQQTQKQLDCSVTIGNNCSIYREILFLTCKAVGRTHIDLNAFDKEYSNAFTRIPERNAKLYGPQDSPITIKSIYCRQYFRPLLLA